MKSSSRAGPRRPTLSESWLVAIGTPWLVVRAWPPESTRTRSSGPLVGLIPAGGSPSPVFAEAVVSVSVLAVIAGSSGSTAAPACGELAALPYSSGLFGLNGISAARACVPSIFAARASDAAAWTVASECDGPLVVERALVVTEDAPRPFPDAPDPLPV